MAQAPQAFKYQAVVRDAGGQVLADQNVGLKINLIAGDTVYIETHNATTNAFGLVNLEIGRGMVQFGDFAQIDWKQTIFIQVSLDATGGTDFQIMGFAELLSVPYALYATEGGSKELPVDPQVGDIAFYDGSAWQRLAAGAPGTVLTMGEDGLPAWQKIPGPLDSLLEVTLPNDETIYAHPRDNCEGIQWGPFVNITALADITTLEAANMDFAGRANTAAIVAQLGDNGGIAYSAKVCEDLVAFGFDDWYLPAAGELNELHKQLGPGGSGQITSAAFWSSTEINTNQAWGQSFFVSSGGQIQGIKSSVDGHCRCVRRE